MQTEFLNAFLYFQNVFYFQIGRLPGYLKTQVTNSVTF